MNPAQDRRVEKTRALLIEALNALVHEKPYQEIVVKEILARANVGRSTFYMHFRDKDELLLACIEAYLEAGPSAPGSGPASERAIRFSGPIFQYIDRQLSAGRDRLEASGHAELHQQLGRALTDRLRREFAVRHPVEGSLPADLLAEHVASSFIRVLEWWVQQRERPSLERANTAFRELVLPQLRAALD